MDYEYKELENRLRSLPKEMQATLTSTEIADTVRKIGQHHNLKLDQESVLFDQIAYILLGLSSPKDFVKNFSKDADVDMNIASTIAKDINTEISGKFRSLMQSTEGLETRPDRTFTNVQPEQGQKEKDITAVEKAGGFEIEREGEMVPDGTVYKQERHTDAIVDHLLTSPVSTTTKTVVRKSPPVPENLPTGNEMTKTVSPAGVADTGKSAWSGTPGREAKNEYGKDPYREPLL